jgi:hypothetical protein
MVVWLSYPVDQGTYGCEILPVGISGLGTKNKIKRVGYVKVSSLVFFNGVTISELILYLG